MSLQVFAMDGWNLDETYAKYQDKFGYFFAF